MTRENLFKELITRNILSVDNNRLKILNSINITMYGSKAWVYTLQEIGKKKGAEHLQNIGYTMGSDAANEVTDVTLKKKKFLPTVIEDLGNIIEITGFGIVNIEERDGNIKVNVIKNHIIDFAAEMYGNESLICHFYCGAYNGFLDIFKHSKLNLKINTCKDKKEGITIFLSVKGWERRKGL